MIENKYYTPKAEEFCIGFEYEEKNNGKWFKRICKYDNPWKLFDFLYEKQKENFRVKFLDKNDIESFGFRTYVLNRLLLHNVNNKSYEIVPYYNMNLKERENLVRIFNCNNSEPYLQGAEIFRGIIKNKSELRKLLIQLQIINE